jgi:hypothetical protein
LPFEKTRLLIKPLKFASMLIASSTSKIIAKTIQPRPRRGGRGGTGETSTGGGGGGGGGGAVKTGGGEGGFSSINLFGKLT